VGYKKRKNKRIAVSGGFDPLHMGHVRMMNDAKKLGDELVVIINNDNWLRKKKGYIFMQEKERVAIIASLKAVDKVVLTKHPKNPRDMSVAKELRYVKPAIFANGGDGKYVKSEDLACKAVGCKIVFGVGRGGKIQSSSWLLNKYSQSKFCQCGSGKKFKKCHGK